VFSVVVDVLDLDAACAGKRQQRRGEFAYRYTSATACAGSRQDGILEQHARACDGGAQSAGVSMLSRMCASGPCPRLAKWAPLRASASA